MGGRRLILMPFRAHRPEPLRRSRRIPLLGNRLMPGLTIFFFVPDLGGWLLPPGVLRPHRRCWPHDAIRGQPLLSIRISGGCARLLPGLGWLARTVLAGPIPPGLAPTFASRRHSYAGRQRSGSAVGRREPASTDKTRTSATAASRREPRDLAGSPPEKSRAIRAKLRQLRSGRLAFARPG